MRKKLCLIGAGSTIFARTIVTDLLLFDDLSPIDIALYDIDIESLRESQIILKHIASQCKKTIDIKIYTNPREALKGADYAMAMFQVGGYKPATVRDFEIPRKYGLRQTIGDTLGIGGIMRALRTIPVLLHYTKIMEEVCPNVFFINYVNPMVMNCWALFRSSSLKMVGICHSVFLTARQLASDLGIPVDEIDYRVAGINHMAFFLSLRRKGEDLYPLLQEKAQDPSFKPRRTVAGNDLADFVRYEILRRFGYFVTESSEHFSEYVPWFIKENREDLIKEFDIPLDEYIRRCEEQKKEWKAQITSLKTAPPAEYSLSGDYGPLIIHSIETGKERTVYANVANKGIISNLPTGLPVEVPCLVKSNSIQPTVIGDLPLSLAALMQTNINVQRLVTEAALSQKKDYIYHAALMDPHTATILDIKSIYAMVDELIEAHADFLPRYT